MELYTLFYVFYEFCWNIFRHVRIFRGDIRYFLWKFDMIVLKSAESSIYKFYMNFIRNCQRFSFKSKEGFYLNFSSNLRNTNSMQIRNPLFSWKNIRVLVGWLHLQFFVKHTYERWQSWIWKKNIQKYKENLNKVKGSYILSLRLIPSLTFRKFLNILSLIYLCRYHYSKRSAKVLTFSWF